MGRDRRSGFSLVELLIVIGIIGLLLAVLLPAAEKIRHRAFINSCASNLRQIGQAMVAYANDNNDSLPRAIYDPSSVTVTAWTAGNDAANPTPFIGPHMANDVTAAIYLLMRVQNLPAKLFICPYNDVNEFTADLADPLLHSNFTDYRQNLGYSFADMYPGVAPTQARYQWRNKFGAQFALAADLSPGPGRVAPYDRLTAVTPTSLAAIRERGNSRNHENEGQNVLYGDGHVEFQITCLCGKGGDNIYMNRDGHVDQPPVDADDSLLLPFDPN